MLDSRFTTAGNSKERSSIPWFAAASPIATSNCAPTPSAMDGTSAAASLRERPPSHYHYRTQHKKKRNACWFGADSLTQLNHTTPATPPPRPNDGCDDRR